MPAARTLPAAPHLSTHDDGPARVHPRGHRPAGGFTMVEILAVVIVLGILSGIAVPQYLTHRTKARIAAATSDARNTGELIEESWAKDRRYPDSPSEVSGWRLSDHNEIARYEVDNTAPNAGFAVCVVYKDDPAAAAKAYAVYDSRKGGIIGKGSGSGGTLCTPNLSTPPAPADGTTGGGSGGGGSGGGGGGGGTSGSGGSSSSLAAPANLTVSTVAGIAKATLNWQSVDGADGYAVFLDGATTPAWSGMATNTELTGLPKGYHEVNVRATKGSDKSDPSAPASFTIYGDNDFLANAHPVTVANGDPVWRSADYNNTGKSAESGEPADSINGLWWTFTPQKPTSVEIKVVAASDATGPFSYPSLYVWESSTTDVTALGTQVAKQTGSGGTVGTLSMVLSAGKTYKIRISTMSTSWVGKFRLQVSPGPANDNFVDATPITSLPLNDTAWFSANSDTTYAGTEPGEPVDGTRSLWWTMVAPRTAGYEFRVVPTSDNVNPYAYNTLTVWDANTNDISTLGATPLAKQAGSGGDPNVVWFSATKGHTIKFRLSTPSGGGQGRFRMRVTPGPANDGMAEATEITISGPGQTWTSPDVDNTYAHYEPGETYTPDGSMWWTYTATTTGNVTVEVIRPTDGTNFPTYPFLRAWKTTTTDVTALGTFYAGNTSSGGLNPIFTMATTAGETYKIRVSISNSRSTSYRGDYRLKVTS